MPKQFKLVVVVYARHEIAMAKMWKLMAKFMYISSWQYRTSQIIFVHSFAFNKTNYIIEVMELYDYFFHKCMYKERQHSSVQQDIVKLMHHCLFDVFWLPTVGYIYGTPWLEGIFACFKENGDIYYYSYYYYYYYQYNFTSMQPELRGMNLWSYSFKICKDVIKD